MRVAAFCAASPAMSRSKIVESLTVLKSIEVQGAMRRWTYAICGIGRLRATECPKSSGPQAPGCRVVVRCSCQWARLDALRLRIRHSAFAR